MSRVQVVEDLRNVAQVEERYPELFDLLFQIRDQDFFADDDAFLAWLTSLANGIALYGHVALVPQIGADFRPCYENVFHPLHPDQERRIRGSVVLVVHRRPDGSGHACA